MTDLRITISGNYFKNIDSSILLLEDSGKLYYLAFALPIWGGEQLLFPESLLDDWGHEINSLSLYGWLQKNGPDFPRAEIFGYDQSGKTMQAFMRDVDFMSNYPCYILESRKDPVEAGNLVTDIVVPSVGISKPVLVNGVDFFSLPMSKAQVRWWQADPAVFEDKIPRILMEHN